jgi:peptidoglycan-N-acetylglucosamine deacetylase
MKKLTITFDNGPDPDCTPMVLDILKSRAIKSTFFVCGLGNRLHPALQADTSQGRALLDRMRDEGHWIGNHTLTHTVELGTTIDEAQIAREIGENQAFLSAYNPRKYLRPYMAGGLLGERTFSRQAIKYICDNQFTLVLFNCCPRDWEHPEAWPEAVFEETQDIDWAMIIVHDVARYDSMPQLARFLDEVSARGISIVQDFAPDCMPVVNGKIVLPIDHLLCGDTPAEPRPFSAAAIPTINPPVS